MTLCVESPVDDCRMICALCQLLFDLMPALEWTCKHSRLEPTEGAAFATAESGVVPARCCSSCLGGWRFQQLISLRHVHYTGVKCSWTA